MDHLQLLRDQLVRNLHFTRQRQWSERALALAREAENRALIAEALCAVAIGKAAPEATALYDEAVKLARESSDKQTLAWVLSRVGTSVSLSGNTERAAGLQQERCSSTKKQTTKRESRTASLLSLYVRHYRKNGDCWSGRLSCNESWAQRSGVSKS